ncbi:MAG: porin [Ramlibacter sp.]|nr:porin [Ramlibacter sp.]
MRNQKRMARLAAAVLACTGAGWAAQAHAQQGSVQLYGIVDTGLVSIDRGRGRETLVASGGQAASRWGLRGTEDLGGGMSALFNLEGQFDSDTGDMSTAATAGFVRRSIVGLRGAFGELTLGRDYTPAYWALLENDISRFGLFGTLQSINSLAVATPRASNGIFYATPVMGGIQLRVMHALGEGPVASPRAGDVSAVGARFGTGAFYANLSYLQMKVAGAATPAGTPVTTRKQLAGGGGYDFGTVRVTAGAGYSDPFGPGNKVTFAHVGAAMKTGAGQWLAQIIRLKTEVANGRASTLGLSYTHELSKRTNLYASYGKTSNNGAGSFPLNISQVSFAPTAAGLDVQGFMVGVRHSF